MSLAAEHRDPMKSALPGILSSGINISQDAPGHLGNTNLLIRPDQILAWRGRADRSAAEVLGKASGRLSHYTPGLI